MPTEYRIKIQNELSVVKDEKTSKSGDVKRSAEKVKEKAQAKQDAKSNPALAVALQLGERAVKTALANYGNLTGDYIGQSYIQVGTELATDVLTIVKGGWVGAGIVATKRATQIGTYILDNYKQKLANNLLAERLGIKE